jgi:hypothetical protein
VYLKHLKRAVVKYQREKGNMSLREELLDEIIAGKLGNNGVVTRQEIINHFPNYPETYTGVFLSNSEMDTGQHSPTYEKFTQRIDRGVYQIHPNAINERRNEQNT